MILLIQINTKEYEKKYINNLNFFISYIEY